MDEPADSERAAVLVIRLWTEAGGGFRARLVGVGELPYGAPKSAVASTADELVELVRGWIGDVAG
ncbi:hypothetical protein ACFWY9_33255 [Amycolatopsis sp. NPDC059027]|uniref:hypothetical protein n=1 Tax=unclassified Amycolatopsis TaxID=2618356 RepID=UPI00366FC029